MPHYLIAALNIGSLHDAITGLDAAGFRAINGLSGNLIMDWFMVVLTCFGTGIAQAGINLFIILVGLLADRLRIRQLGYAGLVAWMASGALAQGAKHFWDRPRPMLELFDAHAVDSPLFVHSFPSGHTATAFAVALAWAAFLPKWRYPLIILAVGVGISRIYLGAHFPLDVTFGAFLGVLIGVASTRLFHPNRSNSVQEKKTAPAGTAS